MTVSPIVSERGHGLRRVIRYVTSRNSSSVGVNVNRTLGEARGGDDDRQGAGETDGARGVVEPLARRVGVATAPAGADGNRGNAQADRDVGVGRRGGELRLAADEARGVDRRENQRVVGGHV